MTRQAITVKPVFYKKKEMDVHGYHAIQNSLTVKYTSYKFKIYTSFLSTAFSDPSNSLFHVTGLLIQTEGGTSSLYTSSFIIIFVYQDILQMRCRSCCISGRAGKNKIVLSVTSPCLDDPCPNCTRLMNLAVNALLVDRDFMRG